jgi:GxxExxY protein
VSDPNGAGAGLPPEGRHRPVDAEVDDLVKKIIDAAFKVHRALGPGLLESVYEACLCQELLLRQLGFTRQHPVKIEYEGLVIDQGLRVDLLIERKVIVELKAVDQLQPIHEAQVLTYLKLSGLRVGLLINFNIRLFKQGIRRLVL